MCSDFQVDKKLKKKEENGELSGDFSNYIIYTE